MYQRILVPIDGSETSGAGLAEAIRISKGTGAQIRLLHVIEDIPLVLSSEGYATLSADVRAMQRKAGEEILQKGREVVTSSAALAVDTVLSGPPSGRLSEVVAEEARKWGADLIVLGTHGRHGVGRLLLGSDAEQVVRAAPVSVLLVRTPAR